MIITGVVIDVQPQSASAAASRLAAQPGVVRMEGPVSPGRLVAVLEAADESAMEFLVDRILTAEGVLAVNPAYIHFDAQEEMPR